MVGSLTSAPVAELRTIDYEELRNGSINEAAKLFEAAKDDGVFYINLTGDNTAELAEHVENIYELSRALFGLNSKVKMQFDVDKLGSLKLNGSVYAVLLCVE
jgi:isopenicillin N synthase-like dioxygenase